MYQAHNNLAWSHGIDLIIEEKRSSGKHETAKTDSGKTAMSTEEPSNLGVKNIVVLRENGIRSLYHFTDASNLESIRAHGLLAWRKLDENKIESKKNSSELSHNLTLRKALLIMFVCPFAETTL